MSYYVNSPLTLWILILSFSPEEVQVVYLKIEMPGHLVLIYTQTTKA